MPTYRNIRIPKRGGGYRLQRAQVLKSGKLKFVKNLKKGKSSASRSSRAPVKRKKRTKTVSRKRTKVNSKRFLGNMSLSGAGEDLAWGFAGLKLLGNDIATLPSVRFIQGATGHLMNRRGKSRLVPAIIDLVDLYLAGATGGEIPLVTQIQQLVKLSPIG